MAAEIVSLEKASQAAVLFGVKGPEVIWPVEVKCSVIWFVRKVGPVVEENEGRREAGYCHEEEQPKEWCAKHP